MPRKLQHIAWSDEVHNAKVNGEKVAMICGAKHYPMTEMSPEIPTCTPCSREMRRELMERLDSTAYTVTFYPRWNTSGGAA